VGGIEAGVGNLGEFFVFLPNVLVIALMGRLFLGAGEDAVEGVTFRQLCCDRCWKRVMAASCSGSGDHVRDVALDVAARKVECENDIYSFKRPGYTAKEWRWLFMTTGSDCYLDSLRLFGFVVLTIDTYMNFWYK